MHHAGRAACGDACRRDRTWAKRSCRIQTAVCGAPGRRATPWRHSGAHGSATHCPPALPPFGSMDTRPPSQVTVRDANAAGARRIRATIRAASACLRALGARTAACSAGPRLTTSSPGGMALRLVLDVYAAHVTSFALVLAIRWARCSTLRTYSGFRSTIWQWISNSSLSTYLAAEP